MSIPYGPILVVEDVPNILDLLTVTLQFKGYPVVTATNGQEALASIKWERPARRILETLPADQKPAFQVLLAETQQHRDAIQMELDNLFKLMEQYND